MSEEKIPHNRTTVTVMVVMIALFMIGIIVRWEYVSQEVSGSFNNLFSPREQKAPMKADSSATDTVKSPASAE